MKRVDLILLLSVLTIATLMLAVKLGFLKSDSSQDAHEDPLVTVPPVTTSQIEKDTAMVTAQPERTAIRGSVKTSRSQSVEILKSQEKELRNIEASAAQKRDEIVQYYSRRHSEIWASAAAVGRSLHAEDQAAWAEFQKKLKNTRSITVGTMMADGNVSRSGRVTGYGNYLERTDTFVMGNPDQQYAEQQRRIAAAKSDTLASLESELVQLQRRTEYELSEVAKWERRMISYVFTRSRSTIDQSGPEAPGTVKGIVSSEDGFCALVGTELVREGDTVGGVKVVKIHADKVEFEKDGKRWTQVLNETPGPEWQ